MPEQLKLYGTATCPQCQGTKKYLEGKYVPFEYIDVLKNAEGLKQLDALNVYALPVLAYGKSFVTGFRPREIDTLVKEAMANDGH